MATVYTITEADRRLLREVIRHYKNAFLNQSRPHVPDQQDDAPEVYVARTPPGGISAAVGVVPGRADCDIYHLVSGALESIGSFSKRVHNLSEVPIYGSRWVVVLRDKLGNWYMPVTAESPSEGEASITGTGTGTGTGDVTAESFKVKVTGADTTPDYLSPKLVAGRRVRITVLTPGASEQLRIDAITGTGTGTGQADFIQNIMVDGPIYFDEHFHLLGTGTGTGTGTFDLTTINILNFGDNYYNVIDGSQDVLVENVIWNGDTVMVHNGGDFNFIFPGGHVLPPNGVVILVRNPAGGFLFILAPYFYAGWSPTIRVNVSAIINDFNPLDATQLHNGSIVCDRETYFGAQIAFSGDPTTGLTGITSGVETQRRDRILVLWNRGSSSATLYHVDPRSQAKNQIWNASGENYVLESEAFALLAYNDRMGFWLNLSCCETAPFTDTTEIVKGSADATKKIRFEADGLTTATTRVLTPRDASYSIGDVYQSSANISSGSTTDLSTVDGLYAHVTGTTTITSFGTANAGVIKVLTFDGALTITHNATSLILPGSTNFVTEAGDGLIVVSEGSGNWRCLSAQRRPFSASAFQIGDVNMATAGTFYNVSSVANVPAGRWKITGTLLAQSLANTTFKVTAKLWDGVSGAFVENEGACIALGAGAVGLIPLTLVVVVTLTGTTTVTLSATATVNTCVLKANPPNSPSGTNKVGSIMLEHAP